MSASKSARGVLGLLLVVLLVAACGKKPLSGEQPQATAPATNAQGPSPGSLAAAARGLPDFTELVARYGSAVVNITVVEKGRPEMTDEEGGDDPLHDFLRRFGMPGVPFRGEPQAPARGEGSGFIVAPDGYILTNAHVVADASDVSVRLTDRREFKAKVIGVDKRTDVAVIKIDGRNLPTVRIGDASKLRPGEWVVAIGSPFGFDNSVTAGIVSATARSMDGQYTPFIQTDAAVNPGNSGGPLFNMAGEVVGINSQIYSRTGGFMGISFAIPIDMAIDVKDQLVATGRVQRGKIGVLVQDVGQQLADSFGLDRPHGAIVSQVESGGPAAAAGLRAGDVILSVDGQAIERSGQLSAYVSRVKPGGHVVLEVWRDRALKKFTVETVELKEGRVVAKDTGESGRDGKLGLALRPLTTAEQRATGLKNGLLVEDARGPALEAGVRPGDVVLGINGERISSIDELAAQVGKSKRSVALLISRDGTTIFIPVRIGG
jgi:serine protease Do